MLDYFDKVIGMQDKCTPESLNIELGISVGKQDSTVKKLTFLESITSGELDFFKLESEEMMAEEKDTNAELRIQIAKCYPALVLLLYPAKADVSILTDSDSDYSDHDEGPVKILVRQMVDLS